MFEDWKDISDKYSAAMNFNNFHRIIFFFAGLSVGLWCCGPFIFVPIYGDIPGWFIASVFGVVLFWNIIALPKHFWVISRDHSLIRIKTNPILGMYCAFRAIKPKQEQKIVYHAMYYIVVAVPFISILAWFVLILYSGITSK